MIIQDSYEYNQILPSECDTINEQDGLGFISRYSFWMISLSGKFMCLCMCVCVCGHKIKFDLLNQCQTNIKRLDSKFAR